MKFFTHRTIFLMPILFLIFHAPFAHAELNTVSVTASLSNQAGRAIISSDRGNHIVVDSVPPLNGPNVALNPIDLMLSALASCGLFMAESSAKEQFDLTDIQVIVEGDFNPRGAKEMGAGDPSFRAFRVKIQTTPHLAEIDFSIISTAFRTHCPIYTTLDRAANIAIFNGFNDIGGIAPVTAKVHAQLSNQPGRAIINAREIYFIVDSIPPLGGPNEELNPLDLMLGAQAACVTFVMEAVANEEQWELASISSKVTGHFAAEGVKLASYDINPRIQRMDIEFVAEGIDLVERYKMISNLKARCPIYTTLSNSIEPINIIDKSM